jgi:hypothetical protein
VRKIKTLWVERHGPFTVTIIRNADWRDKAGQNHESWSYKIKRAHCRRWFLGGGGFVRSEVAQQAARDKILDIEPVGKRGWDYKSLTPEQERIEEWIERMKMREI